jgi:estrone sulfotransferase
MEHWEAVDQHDYVIHNDDVFLCSYPRSGNLWIRYMLASCIYGDRSWSIDSIERVIPCIHHHQGRVEGYPRPRIIKSHFFPPAKYPRVVFLVRDGRDVCVEYYDRCLKLNGYPFGFETFVRELCLGKIWPGAWHRHALTWLRQAQSMPLLLVRYEDLLQDTQTQLHRILDFIGIRATQEAVDNAIAKATPESYRNLHLEIQSYRQRSFTGGVSATYGAWRSMFSDDLNGVFLKCAGKTLRLLGYGEGQMESHFALRRSM